jgi:RHS repeat-associated protein
MRFVPQHILCGLERVRTQSWTYDTAAGGTGLLASHVYPSGMKMEYGYTNGLPTSIRVNGVAFLSNVTYGPGGRITGWTWANGRTMVRTFDGLGRPKTWTMWDVPDARILGYDAAGNLETITRGSDGVVLRRYGYDPRGQLTSYGGSGVTAQSYEYDLAGNRTSYARGANLTAYQYPATSNRLASLSGAETASFGYDANGNPTTYRGQTFLYDIRGRLVGIRDKSKYVVDGLGRRLTKIVRSADAPATFPGDATGDNLLDAEDWWTVAAHRGQLAASYPRDNCDGIGTHIDDADVQCVKDQEAAAVAAGYLEWTDFAYGQDGRPIGEYTSGGRVRETIYLGDLSVGVWDGATAYRIFADHLGTPRGIVNAANQAVWQWEGEPFGNHLPTGSFLYNARFPGQTYDAESGLFYNGFRDYDPRTGRYVEPDPIGLKGGLNLYAYVNGNPVDRVDPKGLTEKDVQDLYRELLNQFNDLKPRGDLGFEDFSDSRAGGRTNPYTGNMFVDKRWAQIPCFTQDQYEELFGYILHEAMHSTDSIPTTYWDGITERYFDVMTENHQRIYNRQRFEKNRTPRWPIPNNVWGHPRPDPVDFGKLYNQYKDKACGCQKLDK